MPTKQIETLDVGSRQEWRAWLEGHHDTVSEIWLVFHKRHTGVQSIVYNDAVEEALCFGWVDSLIRRLDDARYARKFTPRRPDSRWSTANRRRYADLESRGLLAEFGLRRGPTGRSGDAPKPPLGAAVPRYVTEALRASPPAWGHFEKLPPSDKRAYVGWIDSAKREETRARRLRQAIELLTEGKRLGLK